MTDDLVPIPEPAAAPKKKPTRVSHVIIRPLSDVVYFYPLLLASIICGAMVQWGGVSAENPGSTGLVFTLIFFFNLSIVGFDYTRLASIVIVMAVVILVLLSTIYPVVGDVVNRLMHQQIYMNATFYWIWSIGLAMIFLLVFIKTRFDYWEIKNNELLHHHGMLGDVERWPAPGMRHSKEISDVMEYLLIKAGRLVLIPQGERRALVLDNVPRINKVERDMQDLLSMLRVADGD